MTIDNFFLGQKFNTGLLGSNTFSTSGSNTLAETSSDTQRENIIGQTYNSRETKSSGSIFNSPGAESFVLNLEINLFSNFLNNVTSPTNFTQNSISGFIPTIPIGGLPNISPTYFVGEPYLLTSQYEAPKFEAKLEYPKRRSSKYSTYSRKVSGNIDNSYLNLNKAEAARRAAKDPNLEKLTKGKNWSLADTFYTDIPFAKKGTSQILDLVAKEIGEDLVITSALGTGQAGNPHQKSGYASHHNAENPKIDIATNGHGAELARKLQATGYFSRVSLESDHLDVQIDPKAFKRLSKTC